MISLQGKTNFFEKRVGEYQKAGVMTGGPLAEEKKFAISASFFQISRVCCQFLFS